MLKVNTHTTDATNNGVSRHDSGGTAIKAGANQPIDPNNGLKSMSYHINGYDERGPKGNTKNDNKPSSESKNTHVASQGKSDVTKEKISNDMYLAQVVEEGYEDALDDEYYNDILEIMDLIDEDEVREHIQLDRELDEIEDTPEIKEEEDENGEGGNGGGNGNEEGSFGAFALDTNDLLAQLVEDIQILTNREMSDSHGEFDNNEVVLKLKSEYFDGAQISIKEIDGVTNVKLIATDVHSRTFLQQNGQQIIQELSVALQKNIDDIVVTVELDKTNNHVA
jgi:hypothetical protein